METKLYLVNYIGHFEAFYILRLAEEHKKHCNGHCDISLFPLRKIVENLLGRDLNQAEIEVLM